MLIIGDIHINTLNTDNILEAVSGHISKHPNEQSIVFVGDYVYHFSYDRNALLKLFDLFIELYKQGKHVYILAGNHDRLGQHFVYEEARQAFSLLPSTEHSSLHFIVEPRLTKIENKKIFFLPSMINLEVAKIALERASKLPSTASFPQEALIQQEAIHLQQSDNKNEQMSGLINEITLHIVRNTPDCLIIHHYYIADTVFPGQKTKFRYRDIALSGKRCDVADIQLLSGHIHQPFLRKNTLCVGSVRSTSPLEINEVKVVTHLDTKSGTYTLTPLRVNPYVHLTLEQTIDTVDNVKIEAALKQILLTAKENCAQGTLNIQRIDQPIQNRSNISLSLQVPDINYEIIDTYISAEIRNQFKDVKLKKNVIKIDNLLEDLDLKTKDFRNSLNDWKIILKDYLMSRFTDDYKKYRDLLGELKIL